MNIFVAVIIPKNVERRTRLYMSFMHAKLKKRPIH